MARLPRFKPACGGFFHVYNRVAGFKDYFPFHDSRVRKKFMEILLHQVRGAFCGLASFILMGNHFHLVLLVQRYRKLSRDELSQRAKHFYGDRWALRTAHWNEQGWEDFNRRLFDLSAVMSQFEGGFATWLNQTFDRHGHLWAGRYGSTYLFSLEEVQECIFYTELNAVRAGLVESPEDWEPCSARLRKLGQEEDLMPLELLFPEIESRGLKAYEEYRQRLLYRGLKPTSEKHARISEAIVAYEQERGFKRPGTFLQRHAFFVRGIAIGSREAIAKTIARFRQRLLYKRRKHPVSQLGGLFFTVRQQRTPRASA